MTAGRYETRVESRDQDPRILFCGVTKGASMASGSRAAWHDSAPRTVEVVFEDVTPEVALPKFRLRPASGKA